MTEISPNERRQIREDWKTGSNVRELAARFGHGTRQIAFVTKGVKRDPCGCGRDGGHHGSCWFNAPAGKIPIWVPEADAMLKRLFATFATNQEIAAQIARLRGRPVNPRSIIRRARKLKLYRTKEFRRHLRIEMMTGRKKGTRNRGQYPERKVVVPLLSREAISGIKKSWQAGISRRRIALGFEVRQGIVRHLCEGLTRDPCACGRPAGHAGRCSAQIDRDEKQRAAFQRWVLANKKWTEQADNTVRLKYPTKIPVLTLAKEMSVILGYEVTESALSQRAALLNVKRTVRVMRRVPTGRRRGKAVVAETQAIAIFAASNEAAKSDAATKRPFQMMSTRGPDPYAKIRLEQIANASRGRL